MQGSKGKKMKGNLRQEQKEFLKKAIAWLETYPDTQSHDHGNYLDHEDVDLADEIAAYLSAQLKEMPNEA